MMGLIGWLWANARDVYLAACVSLMPSYSNRCAVFCHRMKAISGGYLSIAIVIIVLVCLI